MSDRIRWEDDGMNGFTGYAGTRECRLFDIWQTPSDFGEVTIGEWVLATTLPGRFRRDQPHGDDSDDLKAEAERWLEEFVASLGATFPAEAAGNEASQDEAGQPAPPAKRPVLTSMYVFDVLYSAGFTPWGNGEPGFTTGWHMDAITVDHVGADLPVHGPLEGPRAIVADYAQTLFAAGFDTHITVNTVLVRKKAAAKTATAGEEH